MEKLPKHPDYKAVQSAEKATNKKVSHKIVFVLSFKQVNMMMLIMFTVSILFSVSFYIVS